jgi:hypothetical protein
MAPKAIAAAMEQFFLSERESAYAGRLDGLADLPVTAVGTRLLIAFEGDSEPFAPQCVPSRLGAKG